MIFTSFKRQIVFVAMAAALSFAPGKGQAADGDAPAITIGVGKSRLVELPSGYSDVMIGDPKIADVQPLNQRSVYVVGKGMGSTSLTVYGTGRRVIYSSDVVVSADLDGLRARLHEILPDETNVKVSTANQSILLSGTASSPTALHQVVTLADTYNPGKVVNMMSVQGTQQVMLSVRFVEMERTTAKNLRLNVDSTVLGARRPSVFVSTGDTVISSARNAAESFGFGALAGAWAAAI